MTTTTDKKKIQVAEARAQLSDKLMEYKTETNLKVQLHHLTRGKEHTPVCDEIRVMMDNNRYYVLFGVEYDDKGFVALLYKTNENGKRTNIPFATEQQTNNKDNLISRRLSAAKEEAKAKPQPKTAEKAPVKAPKRVIKKTAPVTQSERLS